MWIRRPSWTDVILKCNISLSCSCQFGYSLGPDDDGFRVKGITDEAGDHYITAGRTVKSLDQRKGNMSFQDLTPITSVRNGALLSIIIFMSVRR